MQNSDQTSFKIVLTGFPKPGISIQEAEQNLSKLLPIEFSKIQIFLQGTPSTIKRNLTIESIDRYRQALNQTGVEFEIVADDVPELLSTNVTRDDTPLAAGINKLPECPKCGYQAKDKADLLLTKHNGMGECPKCGVIPRKYFNVQQENIKLNDKSLLHNKSNKEIIYNLLIKIDQLKIKAKKTIKKYIGLISKKLSKNVIRYIFISITALVLIYLSIHLYVSRELIEVSKALNKISAATEVGVSYRDYRELVIDAKGKINSVDVSDDRLNAAIEMYIDALNIWKYKIENEHSYVITSDTTIGDDLLSKYSSRCSLIVNLDNGEKGTDTDMFLQWLWARAGELVNDY